MPNEIQIGHRFITSNVVEFWVKNLPHDCLCKCPQRFQQANYGYFWRFGDGGYSLNSRPIYEFDSTTDDWNDIPYTVKVEVHPKWSDDELSIKEDSETITINSVESIDEYPDEFSIPTADGGISIAYNRNPVPGHHLTYIIQYINDIKPTGLSLFIPNQKLLNPTIQNFGFDLTNTTSPSSSYNLIDEIKWQQNGNTILGKKTIFVKVDVKDDLDPNNTSDNLIDGLLQNNIMEVPLDLSLATSFDPNKKTVSPAQISGTSQITVTIDFQNIGDGSTDSITVIDKIHPLLDLNSFCFKSVQLGDDPIENILDCQSIPNYSSDINWNTREITFTLDPATLTGLAGLPDCAEDLTTGIIEYTISTVNLGAVPDSTSFGTNARIYFDTNGAIHTNHAYVQLNACAEISDFESCSYTKLYGDESDNGVQDFLFDIEESQKIAITGYNPHIGVINKKGEIVEGWNLSATNIPNSFTDILRTRKEDFLLVGTTPTVPEDYFVVKIGGEEEDSWVKTYNNSGKRDRRPHLIQSNGDTYILAGWWAKSGVTDDLQLIKIDDDGDVVWSKAYEMGGDDQLRGVCSNGEGGLVVVGEISASTMPAFVVEIDSMGNVVQNKKYNTTIATNPAVIPREVIRSKDGNYVMVGEVFSSVTNSNKNGFIAKLDKNNLDTIWVKEFLGESEAMILKALTQDEDENFYLTGYFKITSEEYESMVIKCDSEGNFLWAKKLVDGYGTQLLVTPEQELIVAGISENFHSGFGGKDVFLTKTDTSLSTCITKDIPNTPISHTWQIFDGSATPTNTNITVTNTLTTTEEYVTQELELCPNICTNASSDKTICSGESVQLRGTFFEDATYTWTKEGGDSIGNSQNIIVAPIETTRYFLTINHLLGCETIDEIIVYVDESQDCCIDNILVLNQYTEGIPTTINQPTLILGGSLIATPNESYDISPEPDCNPNTGSGAKPSRLPLNETNIEPLLVYPNPFHDDITIEYSLTENTTVSIILYDTNGRVVKEVLMNEYQEKGFYQIKAKLCNLSEGVYYCQLRIGQSNNQSTKIIKH